MHKISASLVDNPDLTTDDLLRIARDITEVANARKGEQGRINLEYLSPDEWVGQFYRAIRYWGQIAKIGDQRYKVVDLEADKDYTITWTDLDHAAEQIVLGKTDVAPYIAQYIVRDDLDDEAGDCIVQIACFGEVKYS